MIKDSVAKAQFYIFIRSCPGVGKRLARKVINKFTTVESYLNDENLVESLVKIEGMGEKTAWKLVDHRNTYEQWVESLL